MFSHKRGSSDHLSSFNLVLYGVTFTKITMVQCNYIALKEAAKEGRGSATLTYNAHTINGKDEHCALHYGSRICFLSRCPLIPWFIVICHCPGRENSPLFSTSISSKFTSPSKMHGIVTCWRKRKKKLGVMGEKA